MSEGEVRGYVDVGVEDRKSEGGLDMQGKGDGMGWLTMEVMTAARCVCMCCCLLLRQSVESWFGCAHLSHSSSLRPASGCEGVVFSLLSRAYRIVCVSSVYSTVRTGQYSYSRYRTVV